jgi:CyaY protein
MVTDHEFINLADGFMAGILAQLDEIDPDDLDTQLAMGVLTMEFPDGKKCIMNRQTAAHQIWLAHGATAWHFALDEDSGEWRDTKGRGELREVLATTLSQGLGQPLELTPPGSRRPGETPD